MELEAGRERRLGAGRVGSLGVPTKAMSRKRVTARVICSFVEFVFCWCGGCLGLTVAFDVKALVVEFKQAAFNVEAFVVDFGGAAFDVEVFVVDFDGQAFNMEDFVVDFGGVALDIKVFLVDFDGSAICAGFIAAFNFNMGFVGARFELF